MDFLKKIVYPMIKPILMAYLKDRALVLPLAKKAEIATRLKMSVDQVTAVNDEIDLYALAQADAFKP